MLCGHDLLVRISERQEVMSITMTPTGHEVNESILIARMNLVSEVKDFRLEQLNTNSYRVIILPSKNADLRGIKGSVLDALVDVYGMKANYEIDINTYDDELTPKVNEKCFMRDFDSGINASVIR